MTFLNMYLTREAVEIKILINTDLYILYLEGHANFSLAASVVEIEHILL